MSVLTLTEYASVLPNGCPVEPALATQSITYTITSTQSSAFNAATRYVRLSSDTICSVAFGASPTAVTLNATRLAVNVPSLHYVSSGALQKVAVVQ